MEPTEHASRAQILWRDADLRIWCVGGWWFQMKGRPRRRLDSGDAATGLLRHLALNVGEKTTRPDLQRWLARKPKKEIGVASLNTAVSRLRSILREAAGKREDLDELMRRLVPRPKMATTEDGASTEATYELPQGLVWVDLSHASSGALGSDLLPPAFELEPTDGRGSKGEFQGEERLKEEIRRRSESTSMVKPEAGLDPHLKEMTPPISSLTALVPMALDRLGPGKLLSILAPADSGRMHLAEAIEFAGRVYCGRSTEEIREQPEGGAAADKLSAQRPGHLCILDATRDVREEQISRLEEIAEAGGEALPSLLLVRNGPLPDDLAFLAELWDEEEPIQLQVPGPADVLEAYLIGTAERGSLTDRTKAFAELRKDYERHFKAPIGLRAAASAASVAAKRHAPPCAKDLPEPPSDNFRFDGLPLNLQELVKSLAWFGNRPFDLADARAVSGREDLEETAIFGIATKIPGGDGAFELRPQLIDLTPPFAAHGLICQYLVKHPKVEPVIERWPGRAMRILDRQEIPIEDRLDLAMRLFETCRTQGLATRLMEAMEGLREEAEGRLDEKRAEFWIENARLLTYLGKKEEADRLLVEVLAVPGRKGEWPALRARARLRRAIIASRGGDADLAGREARLAQRNRSMKVKVEAFYGWEAIKTGRLEAAVEHFRSALKSDGKVEERADAAIGLSRTLIRLDRRREAEEAIATVRDLDLRRHTRDRLARVNAALCQMRGDPSAGIDRYIDPALLSAGSNFSASAVLFEASAFLHLEAKEVNAAAEDIERSRLILQKSSGESDSSGRYVRALIYEAEAEAAHGQTAVDLLARAREEADACIGEETDRDPWSRARAETLRGRLALLAHDPDAVGRPLSRALEAHRLLGVVCPEILSQTLEFAQRAAGTWGVTEEGERADRLAERLDPKRSLRRPDLDEVLSVVGAVLERVEEGPPASSSGAGDGGLELLGRVGEAVAEAVVRAQLAGLRLQVLVPRALDGLPQGVYDSTPDGKGLQRHPMSPAEVLNLIGSSDEQRLVQRYATCVLLASAASEEDGAFVTLGEWIAELKADARERGIAVGDSIGVDAVGFKPLVEVGSIAVVALSVAELPDLT